MKDHMSTPTQQRADFDAAGHLRHRTFSLTDIQIRTPNETGDGSYTFTGHAAVYNTPTVLYSCPAFRIVETIAPGAFRDVLATDPDVWLNINHNMDLVMARTNVNGVGGLELSEDATGLRVFAKLDPTVSYIADLAKLMQAGVISQMSFCFTPGETTMLTTTDADGFETDQVTQNSVAALYDVCACPMGAYSTTDSSVRELVQVRTNMRADRVASTDSAGTQIEAVAPDVGSESVEVEPGTDERIAARKLEVKKTLAKLKTPTHKEL